MNFSELVNKVDVVKVSSDRSSITCRIIKNSDDVDIELLDKLTLEELIINKLGEYIFSSYYLFKNHNEAMLVGYIN